MQVKVSGNTAQSQERHTPETDHLCWVWTQSTEDNSIPPFDDVRGSEMVFADLARKLESERDHLREQNRELVEVLGAFLLHAEEDWQVTFKHDIKAARAVLAKVR